MQKPCNLDGVACTAFVADDELDSDVDVPTIYDNALQAEETLGILKRLRPRCHGRGEWMIY